MRACSSMGGVGRSVETLSELRSKTVRASLSWKSKLYRLHSLRTSLRAACLILSD